MLHVSGRLEAIAALAARQHGDVSRKQLRRLGISDHTIDRWLKAGRLHPLFRGVYLVGHSVPPPLAREHGAVLACEPDAILSHRSAAVLWGLLVAAPGDVDVTVAGRHVGGRRGIRVHRFSPLHPADFRRRHGIPVTAPPRTVLDLAEVAEPREVERAFDEAATQALIHPAQMRDLIARSSGRRGAAAVAALLGRDHGPTLTRSDLEEIFLALVRAAGLPVPEVNVRLGRYEADFWWPHARLNVEIDSRRYHRLPKRVEHDRGRDAELGPGIRVIRIGERRLLDEREWVVARVAQALAAPSA